MLVSNGYFNFATVYAYSMAENEYVVGSISYDEYLPDSINGSESSVKFTYSYETLAGEIGTGEFTLQIQ